MSPAPGRRTVAHVAAGARRRMRARARRGAVVLLYHRVAALARDPWELAVTPARFDAQLAMLARRYQVLPLDALLDALAAGRVPRRAVAVTFDDAYGDVAREALPRLERYGVPATVFAVSGAVGSAREFWWDELERLVHRGGPLPAALAIPAPAGVGGAARQASAVLPVPIAARAPEEVGRGDRARPAGHAPAPSARDVLYVDLWRRLQPLAPAHRTAALDALTAQLGDGGEARPTYLPCTAAELRAIAATRVGTVGAHTVSHPTLATSPAAEQADEVAGSRQALEALLGRPVTLFAYPYGEAQNYTAETVELVRTAGFRGACANVRGTVRAGMDAYQLPRLYVSDWDAATLAWHIDALLADA